MLNLYVTLQSLFAADRNEKGATATEYALIIAFIALVIIGGLTVFGDNLDAFWSRISGSLTL